MRRETVLVCVVLFMASACRDQSPAPAPSQAEIPRPEPKRATTVAAEEAAEEAAMQAAEAEQAEKAKEMLSAHAKKREILVGGCARHCRAPLDGFRSFARALWDIPDPDEVQPMIRFVDTAELMDGEEAKGHDWAQLFLGGHQAERREGIEKWRESFVASMGRLDDPAELQAALDGPLDMTRISSEVVVIHFALPTTDRESGGEVWHFTFGKRGLEWLLRRIERP